MIGIFDSGIGGLTVAKAIMNSLPSYDIVYMGDTARTPYGTKSAATIAEYSLQVSDFLFNIGAKIIVIACNTASSAAYTQVCENFGVPVFEPIEPAVDLALKNSRKKQIGVIGTRATVKSGVYEKMIMKKNGRSRIHSAACPLLVPIVEEGWLNRPETTMIIKKYLHPLKTRQIDSLILGCTHFPILKKIIQRKMGKRVYLVDSSLAIAEKIKSFLEDHPDVDEQISKTGSTRFMVSDLTDRFEQSARTILKRRILLEHADL
ncbi:glutamate racemase [Desulfobacterales bacterium HSG16]|nr:glutamate racemase [Desulfobacterales bacterium HSG16]